jgi:hypothetical protein
MINGGKLKKKCKKGTLQYFPKTVFFKFDFTRLGSSGQRRITTSTTPSPEDVPLILSDPRENLINGDSFEHVVDKDKLSFVPSTAPEEVWKDGLCTINFDNCLDLFVFFT